MVYVHKTHGSDQGLARAASIRRGPRLGEYAGDALALHRVCQAASRELPLVGSVVRLLEPSAIAGLSIADGTSGRRLAALELEVGEGPGQTAYALRHPVLVSDLAGTAGDGWPGYRLAALGLGAAAVFAFPLQLGAVVFGTLELFAGTPGPLSPAHTDRAGALAGKAVEILLGGAWGPGPEDVPVGLAGMFEERACIAQAQGMVMVDLGVGLTDALVRLRAHAFARGSSLREVAQEVIDGYRLPTDAPGADEP